MSDPLYDIVRRLSALQQRVERLANQEVLPSPVPVKRGGTGANLAATGGANQIVRQNSVGGALTVSALAAADIPSLDTSKLTSGTLAAARGGTGVSNAGTLTNASNTTITGGGTLALGGYTLTIPASDTAALLGQAQTFSAKQTISAANAAQLRVATPSDTYNGVIEFSDASPSQQRVLALNFINSAGSAVGQMAYFNDPTGANQYFRIVTNSTERFRIDGNGRPYFYSIRTSPASPASGEIYKDGSGFLKIG